MRVGVVIVVMGVAGAGCSDDVVRLCADEYVVSLTMTVSGPLRPPCFEEVFAGDWRPGLGQVGTYEECAAICGKWPDEEPYCRTIRCTDREGRNYHMLCRHRTMHPC